MSRTPTAPAPSPLVPAGAPSLRVGEGARGLWSTSTVVGLHFQSLAAAGSGFAGTAPIAGKVQLEGLFLSIRSAAAAEDPMRLQLAIGSNVPSTQAGIDGEEQMFPRASQAADSRYDLVLVASGGGFFLPVSTVLMMNGRRIVGRWYNGASATDDFYVGLILHRVIGGDERGDPGFLSGEEIFDA